MTVKPQERVKVMTPGDLTALSRSFPSLSGIQVQRDNVLQLIDTMFEDTAELVTVEGTEGIGKTTLVAQFAKRRRERCFSVFVRSASRFAYDPSVVVSDVSDQIASFLYGDRLSNVSDPAATYRRLILELQKRPRKRQEFFYFVLDGLDDLPQGAPEAREIIELLPFGLPQFRFVLSGEIIGMLGHQGRTIKHRPLSLPGFTLDECNRFFADSAIPPDCMHEFYKSSKGVPAHLAAIRRVLATGIDPRPLAEKLPITLPSLFVMEWRRVAEDDQLLLEMLALISQDRQKHTVSSLADLFGIGSEDVRARISGLGFLVQPTPGSEDVEFVSESFRQFAAAKLGHLKEQVRAKVIDTLLEKPGSEMALECLPTYLEEAGRLDDLLEFLSPEHFAAMIASSGSLAPVRQKAALGLSAAGRLQRDSDMLRFGLESSVIAAVDECEVTRSEIRARMALGDYKSAVALAQGAVLKQDRLRLLAVIARLQAESGLTPESEIVQQIRQLFGETDSSSLKGKTLDLASDLMYSLPDLAVQLVEQPTGQPEGDRRVDWALASLTGYAALSKEQSIARSAAEGIRLRIKDPGALRLSTAVLLLVGRYTSSDVLREVERLANPIDQLFLLRLWAENASDPGDAGAVVDHALRLAIRTSEYTPVATDLRQLATVLHSVSEVERLRSLVGIFDTQKSIVEKLGPTVDYVRLQLFLVLAEARYDPESAGTRLLETYYYVADLKDLELRMTCAAWLLAELDDATSSAMRDGDEVRAAARKELADGMPQLLGATADHYSATRHVIEALARGKPELGLEIAMSLNTEPRRDLALSDLVRVSLRGRRLSDLPLEFLQKALDRFADTSDRDVALREILGAAAEQVEAATAAVPAGFEPLFRRISWIGDSARQCDACCDALRILFETSGNRDEAIISTVRDWLRAAFDRLEDDQRKANMGFTIASSIAHQSHELASEYLEAADRLRSSSARAASGQSYLGSVRLALRSFSGLLPKRFDVAEDLERLSSQIERVASDLMRSYLWGDLALQFLRADRIGDAKLIISRRLRPLLDTVRSRDEEEWHVAVSLAGPALYAFHKLSAFDLVGRLPLLYQQRAYRYMISFILSKFPPWEPYDRAENQYQLSYEDAVDVVEILDKLDVDFWIYATIVEIVCSVLWKQNKTPFTQQQKADIAQRLGTIVEGKLPAARFIAHDGYKLLSNAQISRLTRQRSESLEHYVAEADKINNTSDRVYIIMELVRYDTNADFLRRVELVKIAKSLADKIPSVLDRVGRYQLIAEYARDIDPATAKQCIQEAFGIVPRNGTEESQDLRRDLVDFAYEIDPEWASSLAASFDDDVVRKDARRRIAFQEFKKRLSGGGSAEPEDHRNWDEVRSVAWSLLGKLNAGRVEPLTVSSTRHFVSSASERPMDDAFPVLSWVIQNAIERRAFAAESKRLLRGIFEATLASCELSFRLSGRASDRVRGLVAHQQQSGSAAALIIRGGERSRAMEFLTEWLENATTEYLKICDPYFGPDDLEALQLVLRAAPSLRVAILTSRKQQQSCGEMDTEKCYARKWKSLSDQDPPETEVVVVGNSSGDLPIHDRWWITRGRGLRIGTSFGSLGGRKESEISVLGEEEARAAEARVDEFLETRKREHNGERLSVLIFSIKR